MSKTEGARNRELALCRLTCANIREVRRERLWLYKLYFLPLCRFPVSSAESVRLTFVKTFSIKLIWGVAHHKKILSARSVNIWLLKVRCSTNLLGGKKHSGGVLSSFPVSLFPMRWSGWNMFVSSSRKFHSDDLGKAGFKRANFYMVSAMTRRFQIVPDRLDVI